MRTLRTIPKATQNINSSKPHACTRSPETSAYYINVRQMTERYSREVVKTIHCFGLILDGARQATQTIPQNPWSVVAKVLLLLPPQRPINKRKQLNSQRVHHSTKLGSACLPAYHSFIGIIVLVFGLPSWNTFCQYHTHTLQSLPPNSQHRQLHAIHMIWLELQSTARNTLERCKRQREQQMQNAEENIKI